MADPIPTSLKPQLCSSAKTAPAGNDWIHEIKHDGYRLLCRKEGPRVQLFTRNGFDWTARLPRIARQTERLPVDSCWIDGEMVVYGDDDRTDFFALQRELGRRGGERLTYHVWDLVYLNGEDLTRAPTLERKERLREILSTLETGLLYTGHIRGAGPDVFARADAMDLEGIVSKRVNSRYRPGERSPDWRKVKVWRVYEVQLVGLRTDPRGTQVEALILGERIDGRLAYTGRVEIGVPRMRDLLQQLKTTRRGSPFTGLADRRDVWLETPIPVKVRASPRRPGEPLRQATLAR